MENIFDGNWCWSIDYMDDTIFSEVFTFDNKELYEKTIEFAETVASGEVKYMSFREGDGSKVYFPKAILAKSILRLVRCE